ncbi:MAG: aspartate carbamoyltransferase regulatory subunit [Clostridia bacterium]|nr:aspartate carbamoyltransferase regulatory subunit [Clostridia bacterium]
MKIDSINRGYVLDHITAGKAMEIYRYLRLDELDCSVAIIKNVKSAKSDKKDIIKIDDLIDIDLTVLGYIDPGITVNVVKDGQIVEKLHLSLPEEIVNVVRCKNPRCITSTEQELDHVFRLVDREKKIYRCIYCESKKG